MARTGGAAGGVGLGGQRPVARALAGLAAPPRYWSDDEPGQLKSYSSRGPRITGDRTIDIVAPTDPYAPAPYNPDVAWDTWPAEYITFGGTTCKA